VTTPETLFAILEDMSTLDTPIRSTTSLHVYDDLAAAHSSSSIFSDSARASWNVTRAGIAVHGVLFAGDQVICCTHLGSKISHPRAWEPSAA
jgi:hypothetical protein